ncbi:ATP-binding cassette domain-containing protein [Microcella sp.]|uniref:ATP-binding cassette domain-containing protein n=1 Tax=Microcella sp. TaxID=1913979 RepID=UPI00391CE8E0
MTTATAAALGAHGWSWTPAGRTDPVLADLELSIAPGERVLLLGASGSGKSTLLQAWAGVLGGADEGERQGQLTVDDGEAGARRGRVGLLLQDPDAQLVLARARDDVAFGPENLGEPVDEILAGVPRALEAVGLAALADADTRRLSGGQQQRLALAGVLAMRPAALLLDEPTAQLDPEGVREAAAAVAALVDEHGLTLVVVEHRVDVWAPLVDRVVVLEAGRVVADGPVADVLGEQGSRLAQGGVWVPGRGPEHPAAPTAAPGDELLRATGLAVRPAGGEPIVLGLDLVVRAGEVVALTGPNGAGKSTLLLTLAGLLHPAAGTIDALGAGAPREWSSRELAARFGVVFQNPEHQFVTATVRDELALGGVDDARVDSARVDALLDRLRLRHLASASPFALSGGEQRRLSVATALASAPAVLLLDEPSFGQDARTWAELAALLAAHRDAGGAVVMATHDRELVAALGAREVALPAATPIERPADRADDGDTPVERPDTPGSTPVSPHERTGRAPLGERINPVAAIAASLVPALLLVTTLDVVSAAIALTLQLLLLPLLGIPLGTLLRRTAPVLIAAPLAAATVVLYGRESGTVYAEFLLVRISDGSLELALATLLRILAIGIPAIALFARPDATRLGDALGQNLRLPSRFVLGGVAALRLLTVLRDDARLLERARRARGIGDRGRVRRALGLVFALLVLSIRRGSALAIGMEARGVGAPGPRTWVRPSPWRASDTAVVVIGIAISVVAVAAAVLTGEFTSVIG